VADDRQYLESLRSYYVRHRVLPSYAAIGRLVGLRSKASVAGLIQRLKTAGFLDTTADRRLKPGARFFERPLLESVRAGPPERPPDLPVDSLALDQMVVRNPAKTVLVKVKGDSMIRAGIHEGDVAVVEKRGTAKAGDLVIAIVDNEFTLKRLALERGRPVLRPENPAYPTIRPKGELEIFGVVVGLVRRYG
jgi:SOS-response transcriptional repressor LexA